MLRSRYDGAKIIFKKNDFEILGITVGPEGIDLDELKQTGSSSLRMGNGMMAPFPIRRYYDYAT